MRKLSAIILCALLMFSSAFVGMNFVNEVGGKDITDEPRASYTITNVWELQNMSLDLAGDYTLANDINASITSGWNWNGTAYEGFEPIGPLGNGFTGTFDGKNFTISELYINRPGNDYVGLFGYDADHATVKNVGLEDVDMTGGAVGGLVGNTHYTTINNCYLTGNINATSTLTGGLVRSIFHSTISNSYSTANVNCTGSLVGGLAGCFCDGQIINCYSTGNVNGDTCVGGLIGGNGCGHLAYIYDSYSTGNVNGTSYVGGLMGHSDSWISISNSYSTGSVTGIDNVGGLVGYNDGIITNCYSTGNASGTIEVGGFAGNNTATITNCFWDMESSGNPTSDGGTGKTTAEMMQQATFDPPWDFTNVWGIVEGVTYPYLQWQGDPTLMAMWPFEEGAGQFTNDTSGNGNDGTLMPTYPSNVPTWTSGISGSALEFDGVDDYVNVTNDSSLNFGTNAFTLEAWIKTSSSAQQTIVSKGDSGAGPSWYMEVISNKIRAGTQSGGSYRLRDTTVTVNDGTWHHAVALIKGFECADIEIYVDGVRRDTTDASAGTAQATFSNTYSLYVGQRNHSGLGRYFDGTIDEVSIWDRALSPEEIQQRYQDTYKLAAHWPFDEGVGQYTNDTSGNNNNGTLMPSYPTNVPTWTSGISGSALEFDGVDDCVDIGTTSSLDITSPTTIEAWIKSDSSATYRTIFSKTSNNPAPIQWEFIIETNDKLMWYTRHQEGSNDASPIITSNNIVADGTWHHVAVTYSTITGDTELYVDGALDNSVILTSGNIVSSDREPQIGDVYSSSRLAHFDGTIDEVSIWGRTLSPEEIQQHYLDISKLGAHWPFDEGVGQYTNDTSGNNNTGTLMPSYPTNVPTWTSGINGSALDFDGVDDYVDCGNDISLQFGGSMTLSAWFYPDSADKVQLIVSKHHAGAGNGGFFCYYGDDKKIGWSIRTENPNSLVVETTNTYDINQWYHFVGTFDGESHTAEIYINGKLDGEITNVGTILSANTINNLKIGENADNGANEFDGTIDEVSIWNRALSPEEILAKFNQYGGPVYNIDSEEFFDTIQAAIDATNTTDGHTIEVSAGTYFENVVVNKMLTINGAGRDVTTMDGSGVGDVVYVSADWVNISGFTVMNSGNGAWDDVGIELVNANTCIIENNRITMNNLGLRMHSSSNCTVSLNDVSYNNWDAITICEYSNYNLISNNAVNDNNRVGIGISTSFNNTISDNNIWNHTEQGVWIGNSAYENIVINNDVRNNMNGIYLDRTNDNTISNNIVSWNRDHGMCLISSNGTTISNNNISNNNLNGILLLSSSFTIIVGNNFSFNNDVGIQITDSSRNTLMNNIMIENGIFMAGTLLEYWNTHTIDTSNTVNNKPVYYWKNQTGGTVPLGAGQVILANCSNVIIENQNVSNGVAGIELGFSDYNTITNNTANSNRFHGIRLYSSNYNTVTNNCVLNNIYGIGFNTNCNNNIATGNNASNNNWGLWAFFSTNNTIDNNIANSNDQYGIYLLSSNNHTITDNTMLDNIDSGMYVDNSDDNSIANNTISSETSTEFTFDYITGIEIWQYNYTGGDFIEYLANAPWQEYINTSGGENFRYHIMGHFDCPDLDLGLFFDSNGDGIAQTDEFIALCADGGPDEEVHVSNALNGTYILKVAGFTVSGNPGHFDRVVTSGTVGTYLINSEYNNLHSNSISNMGCGVYLIGSTGSYIYHNSFINNTVQAYDEIGTNSWDNGYPSGGNYWSDYSGVDIRSGPLQDQPSADSIGDTPHTFSGNQDNYSLMYPWGHPRHSNEYPYCETCTNDPSPTIWVHVTDESAIDLSSIKLYVNGFKVFSTKNPITGGYNISYVHEGTFNDGQVVTCRIVAGDLDGNVLDWTWTFTVDISPPEHSNEHPAIDGYTSDPTPVISVHVTDLSGVNASTIKFYVQGYRVECNISAIADGYNISYWHEAGFSEGELVTCRIVADDIYGNTLDFTWSFTVLYSFEVSLSAGWNLISLPLIQTNTSILAVLSSIDGQWDYVQYYDASDAADHWKSYATFKPSSLNDLLALDHTMGFWLHTTTDANFTVYGLLPGNVSIPLKAGWNLVGYPVQDDSNYTVGDLKFDTGADLVEGYNSSAPYGISALPDSYVLKKGEGYWVHTPADTIWPVTNSPPSCNPLSYEDSGDTTWTKGGGEVTCSGIENPLPISSPVQGVSNEKIAHGDNDDCHSGTSSGVTLFITLITMFILVLYIPLRKRRK